jgi:hypothetical protein
MTTEERFEKLENIMDRLAERTTVLDEAMVSLAESQEEQYRLTQKQFRDTDKRLAEFGRKTDERIASLVSAIGELAGRTRK